MRFSIRFARRADAYLARLDRRTQQRIWERIDAIADDPYNASTKQLKGSPGLRSIRAGDYRVVYVVLEHEVIVVIERIAPRGQVYRNL